MILWAWYWRCKLFEEVVLAVARRPPDPEPPLPFQTIDGRTSQRTQSLGFLAEFLPSVDWQTRNNLAVNNRVNHWCIKNFVIILVLVIIVVISRLLRFTRFHIFTVIIVSVYCSRFYSFPLISVLAFPFPEFSGLVFSPSSEFLPPIPLRTSNGGSGSRMRPVGKRGGGWSKRKK